MPKTFISYRREDAAPQAARIADRLRAVLGDQNVFFDVDSLQGGDLFPATIEERIDACDVFLVIIGKIWLSTRLTSETDWVRREVERALARKIRVIPVLVSKDSRLPLATELPDSLAELTQHNALEVMDGRIFEYQMQGLIDTLCGKRRSWLKPGWQRAVPWLAAALPALLVAGFLLNRRKEVVQIPDDFHLQIRVQLQPKFGGVSSAPVMKLRQRLPKDLGTNELLPGAPGSSREFEYQPQFIFMPTRGQQYQGDLHREILGGMIIDSPSWSSICFERKAESLDAAATVRLRCQEGVACTLAEDDFGWAKPCAAKQQGLLERFFPTVEAASSADPPAPRPWAVPALSTLQKLKTQSRNPSYSEFLLGSGPLQGLEGADRLVYTVHVNGSPLYFDGLPPDSIPFDSKKGIHLRFGLENLDFSGRDAGFEDMDLLLQFKKGAQVVRQFNVPIRCIALRPMPRLPIVAEDYKMWWQAEYHPGNQDDIYQLFLLSTRSVQVAQQYKGKVDTAPLRIGTAGISAVIRPPNKGNPSFGVILGVKQPSGQIKFTFDEKTSRDLCGSLNALARTSPLVSKSSFRRSVNSQSDTMACGQL
jgi:hypothetical protein